MKLLFSKYNFRTIVIYTLPQQGFLAPPLVATPLSFSKWYQTTWDSRRAPGKIRVIEGEHVAKYVCTWTLFISSAERMVLTGSETLKLI